MKFGIGAICLSLTMLQAGTALAADGRLTLEMLYHPTQKLKFDTAPLTRMSWDAQNRLIETSVRDGVVQQSIINPRDWSRRALSADQNLLATLQRAGIATEQLKKLAEQLAGQITPDKSRYLFSYQNDLWLLDTRAGLARQLTRSPDQSEDEAILSPDANQVAYLKGNDLYVTDIASARETRLTSDGSQTNLNGRLDWVYMEEIYGRGRLRAFWWSPDSSKLAFLNFDESKVPLYTLAGDHTQPARPDLTRYPKAGDPNPQVKLGVIDLQGRLNWTVNPYPQQETLIVQVGWAPDGSLLASWQDRAQTWLDLRRYDAAVQDSKVVLRETSPAWTERLPLPVFLQDGSFIWESDRSGHRHLYHYDQAYRLNAALTSGDWDVRQVYGVDEVRGRILFSANQRNQIGDDVYAVAIGGGALQRLTSERGSHRVRWNNDFSKFLDSWSSLTQTPKQALLSGDGKLLKLIDDVGMPAAMQQVKLAKVSHQVVKARDGFELESLLYLPPDFDPAKKYPVYQHLYGGPHAPQVIDRWSNDLYFHFLAQQGYIVWVLDNRSASNKGVASAWPIYRQLGKVELEDQLDGLAWLAAKGWADMDRVALNGWSYGGYFTAYALTHSKAWKLGFVGAPVTDWRLYDSVYTERYMGLPKDNQQGYDAASVLKAVAGLHGKLMLMHGTMDDNVHPQNTVMLIDELIKADQPYSLQLYPGQAHGPRGDAVIWSLQQAKWRFLRDNL